MTLVQYFVDFLRPYADLPEFTSCVMKALEKLDHPVNRVSACEWEPDKADSVSGEVWDSSAEYKAYRADCDD